MREDNTLYRPSAAATEASEYFNGLPIEERRRLAPLLEHYRQMGFAEAYARISVTQKGIRDRIADIRDRGAARA